MQREPSPAKVSRKGENLGVKESSSLGTETQDTVILSVNATQAAPGSSPRNPISKANQSKAKLGLQGGKLIILTEETMPRKQINDKNKSQLSGSKEKSNSKRSEASRGYKGEKKNSRQSVT